MKEKLIYYFSQNRCEGDAKMRELLGSKGANLAEMCNMGIPVPPGFTLSILAHSVFKENHSNFYTGIKEYMEMLEDDFGCKFGDASAYPLLVSVRSGSVHSMPGMLDTILNVGLNDETVIKLAEKNGARFAYNSYCRLINMYANIVLQLNNNLFENVIANECHKRGTASLAQLNIEALKSIVDNFKQIIYEQTGKNFPQNVDQQLFNSVNAVFASWNNKRAASYVNIYNISDCIGTAVNIQAMVFGNLNNNSATGVVFTRNPITGERKHFGEFLINAQGEDIVSGASTPIPIQENTMPKLMPKIYEELSIIGDKLEKHYKDMQDIEFTIEDGKLWILQTRSGKRTAKAAVRIIVDMVNEKIITKEQGIVKIDVKTFEKLLHPVLDTQDDQNVIGNGLAASPGVAAGYVVFSVQDAEEAEMKGIKVILVRPETSSEDIYGMNIATGIITAKGGMTSHAAVVTRGMGKPCICSVRGLYIDKNETFFVLGKLKVNKGEPLTINGSTGAVMLGILPTILPDLSQEFTTIMTWIDEVKTIKVRANADTPKDAAVAKKFGAEGIGLCRTEHMFFASDRIEYMHRLIISDNQSDRSNALDELGKMQQADFRKIFSIMKNKEITIRLLDPPLHEFLPNNQISIEKLAKSLHKSTRSVQEKIKQLSEKNPMLGHRGCRLAISYPEIYRMQVIAILSAVDELQREKNIVIKPEIMIPFVMHEKEFSLICEMVKKEAERFKVDYLIGTMIELPRAALIADKLAKNADFFSFGTNDLTQTTMGLSRDDSVNFFEAYKKSGILADDPFSLLDFDGVGELIKIAIDKGKSTRQHIKIGICGEHGANPRSIEFFIDLGLDYISCSPYMVPLVKLVAAQSALKGR